MKSLIEVEVIVACIGYWRCSVNTVSEDRSDNSGTLRGCYIAAAYDPFTSRIAELEAAVLRQTINSLVRFRNPDNDVQSVFLRYAYLDLSVAGTDRKQESAATPQRYPKGPEYLLFQLGWHGLR